MKSWRFVTESVPPALRERAWLQAMDRLCLPVAGLPGVDGLAGEVLCLQSPLGTEVARVTAGPHEFSGTYDAQPAGIWVSILLVGEATLYHEGEHVRLTENDIIYGPTGQPADLRFESDFQQLFIKVPQLLFDSQLVAPGSLHVRHIGEGDGIGRVFLSMLRTLAQFLCQVAAEDLRPVEISLTEFLVSSLALERAGTGARSSHLQRICRTIETMLGNPDLSLEQVAEVEGVSTRYLQKLFAEQGETFRDYRRKRRLERCRADLVSPLYANLSITEICFRWGFNGSAHFSRAFRKAFGHSPRDYRRLARAHSGPGPGPVPKPAEALHP